MADERYAGYSDGRSAQAHWGLVYFADGSAAHCSAARYSAARRLQAACPADCLAERCFAAASADSRSDLRSAVVRFQRRVAAALPAGTREPSCAQPQVLPVEPQRSEPAKPQAAG